jgi:hypothetical protein
MRVVVEFVGFVDRDGFFEIQILVVGLAPNGSEIN